MAWVDLKDAYFSMPVHTDHRKFLRFAWNGCLYQFTCLPNGLAEAPRKFTKMMKVPFSTLRKKGHDNSAYLDDSYLQGDNYEDCAHNIRDTVTLLDSLGFTVHPTKSVLVPTQILVFLGFVLNSIYMTVTLTRDKADKIQKACQKLLHAQSITIRQLAEVIGSLVAAEPGADFAPLFYPW